MGAWIETVVGVTSTMPLTVSRPVWARGLKPSDKYKMFTALMVAPHVGAWIETLSSVKPCDIYKSRPVWARGLKQWSV